MHEALLTAELYKTGIMTSLNLTLDLKLWFVTLMVHRITFLIMVSALWSSLVSWTSGVIVVVGGTAVQ
ncbi:hypothetical protein V8E53_013902 [Lactarius tabidus]